jgi:hypothetical protein
MSITINGSGTISGASTLSTTVASPTFTTPTLDSAQFATVSGTAPLYACRAWVNFNGTGTVAIRASGNVSSITDNGTGDYTVNFTTALPDANYAMAGNQLGEATTSGSGARALCPLTFNTSSLRVIDTAGTGSAEDSPYVTVTIFR